MNEKIDTEGIFDETEEEILESVPEPMADYLKAAKKMLIDPLQSVRPPQAAIIQAGQLIRKVKTFEIGHEDTDENLQELLDDHWIIETSFSHEYIVTIIFAKLIISDTILPNSIVSEK